MEQARKVPVTERALVQRINRKLGKYQVLRKARGRAATELGWHIVDTHRGVIDCKLNVAALAKKLGVMNSFEIMAPRVNNG
jgi:hypothetical protein